MLVLDKPTWTNIARSLAAFGKRQALHSEDHPRGAEREMRNHSYYMAALSHMLGFEDINHPMAILKERAIIIGIPEVLQHMGNIDSWVGYEKKIDLQVARFLGALGCKRGLNSGVEAKLRAIGFDGQATECLASLKKKAARKGGSDYSNTSYVQAAIDDLWARKEFGLVYHGSEIMHNFERELEELMARARAVEGLEPGSILAADVVCNQQLFALRLRSYFNQTLESDPLPMDLCSAIVHCMFMDWIAPGVTAEKEAEIPSFDIGDDFARYPGWSRVDCKLAMIAEQAREHTGDMVFKP